MRILRPFTFPFPPVDFPLLSLTCAEPPSSPHTHTPSARSPPHFALPPQCDTLTNKCGGSSADVSACKTFATTITTRDAAAASKWNAFVPLLSALSLSQKCTGFVERGLTRVFYACGCGVVLGTSGGSRRWLSEGALLWSSCGVRGGSGIASSVRVSCGSTAAFSFLFDPSFVRETGRLTGKSRPCLACFRTGLRSLPRPSRSSRREGERTLAFSGVVL